MYLNYIKPVFDYILALISLLLISPLLLILGFILYFHLSESPIFCQERIGKNAKPFVIYKFKTISTNGEITKITRFYRKYKLDELPQLFNILQADMSFVGPRPDIAGYYDKLRGEKRKVLNLKPGLTGYASLKYYNEEEILYKLENPKQYNDNVIFPEKVELNLWYYYNISFLLDIKILLNTAILPIIK